MKFKNLFFLSTLTLLTFSAQAELKAAFINSALILQKAPQAQQATETMKKEFQSREQALRDLAQQVQTMEGNLKKDSAIMSAEQKKKAENEILEKKRKIRFDAQSLKEDVDTRRSQELQKLTNSIRTVIQDYAKKHGYDFIFTENVAFVSDKYDITDEILKELSK